MGSPKSRIRGWEVEYLGNMWVYVDNGLPIDDARPCKQCGEKPTAEGYDACLGTVEGASSVCCGHGGRAFQVEGDSQ